MSGLQSFIEIQLDQRLEGVHLVVLIDLEHPEPGAVSRGMWGIRTVSEAV